jgi:hypothetical protein
MTYVNQTRQVFVIKEATTNTWCSSQKGQFGPFGTCVFYNNSKNAMKAITELQRRLREHGYALLVNGEYIHFHLGEEDVPGKKKADFKMIMCDVKPMF